MFDDIRNAVVRLFPAIAGYFYSVQSSINEAIGSITLDLAIKWATLIYAVLQIGLLIVKYRDKMFRCVECDDDGELPK